MRKTSWLNYIAGIDRHNQHRFLNLRRLAHEYMMIVLYIGDTMLALCLFPLSMLALDHCIKTSVSQLTLAVYV